MSTSQQIYLGNTLKQVTNAPIQGKYVKINGEDYYQITNYNAMPPFFMSIVSNADHWMFISSNGGLTAGRKNPENALFPYYTDDKIHDGYEITGSKTLLLARSEDKTYLWEPFSDKYAGTYSIQRNIYKNIPGNKLIFEEVNNDLQLTFQYAWNNSERFGFVKKSTLLNTGGIIVSVELLDGVQNILPYGVDFNMQQTFSTLVDAYKKDELIPELGLGIYTLSSILTDRAEPSEALKATTAWSMGIEAKTYLVSSKQLDRFRKGQPVSQEVDVRAARGAYFVHADVKLSAGESKEWYIIAEINQNANTLASLINLLKSGANLKQQIDTDIQQGLDNLINIVANADGLQLTNNKMNTSSHFASVLFNVMRGGIFDRNYDVDKQDLIKFVETTNRRLLSKQASFFDTLPGCIHYKELLSKAAASGNHLLERICYEYLPLTFSRRHGDPSRPWNRFSIETKTEDGEKILNYQGNWRDIFQNWEALAFSFPGFAESMISKFVNASTIDGYNPYRIMRSGIDWEILDQEDPWSNIGYWGDHQIIYMLKLLEVSGNHHPGLLKEFLSKDLFAFAHVPYRIKKYKYLLANPYDTIEYDPAVEATVGERVKQVGADGKMVWTKNGDVLLVNLTEKMLVSLLAKFSNFIPEGGIWMNNQRPEWNDANNALVGYGISMVTLYYMRRFVSYCQQLYTENDQAEYAISAELKQMFEAIHSTFNQNESLLAGKISDRDRKVILDKLAAAGETYREQVYHGFSEAKATLRQQDLLTFFEIAQKFIDHSIAANKRTDGLYHAYNLLNKTSDNEIGIRYLYEMLEGQVAVLSSGYLSPDEAIEVNTALRNSKLYRSDQNSYLLYPDRELTRFIDKNFIPEENINRSELLKQLVADNNTNIISRDENGQYHYNGLLRNAAWLTDALNNLNGDYKPLVEKEKHQIAADFTALFDHQSFTGRSGTFYGYEGLGCTYWHMVSKLILSVEENYLWALDQGAEQAVVEQLKKAYYDVRAGLGYHKTADVYGAFPTDPYSHTPGIGGAKQPGMTGQVKEDIITRIRELGVYVKAGKIRFQPTLIEATEFLEKPGTLEYLDVNFQKTTVQVPANALAFTYCQVPVIYLKGVTGQMTLILSDGKEEKLSGIELPYEISQGIFNKKGFVKQIQIGLE